MGRAGYLRVRREFTAARVARQVEGVYREIVRVGGPLTPGCQEGHMDSEEDTEASVRR